MTWTKERTELLKRLIKEQEAELGYVDFSKLAVILKVKKICLYAKCRRDKIDYVAKNYTSSVLHKKSSDIEWLNSKKVNYG